MNKNGKSFERGANGSGVSWPAWVVAMCLFVSLAGIADHELWTPDEPREAAIALSMSQSGNIIIPELAGEPFVEKPPLYYIVASFVLSVLGSVLGNTNALRLTSALWGLGALGMTWMLAKRVMSGQQAVLAVLILATMPGFIHVSHWLLVDNALVFFVVASLWAFVEAYEGGRARFLILAGLFTAGAFLTKGLIGPIVIGLGWLGLSLPWISRRKTRGLMPARWWAMHLAAFVLFAIPVLLWMLNFRVIGGSELWNEWFWTNHFGRFSGQAGHLGHIKGPFYYFQRAPVMMLPWSLIFVVGLVRLLLGIRAGKIPGRPWPFLLSWGIGGFVLFTLSSTKRDIYLIVLLPAFAMMTSLMLTDFFMTFSCSTRDGGTGARPEPARWARNILSVWAFAMMALLAVSAAAPVLFRPIRAIISRIPAEADAMFTGWTISNSIAIVALILMAVLMSRRRLQFLHRWFAVTAFTYIMLLSLLCPALDRVKNYEPAFRNLARGTAMLNGEIALWNPDETTRAGFYYYCGLVFPALFDIVDLISVLDGTHQRFNGLIVLSKNFPPQDAVMPEWVVLQSENMGPRRALCLIGPKDK